MTDEITTEEVTETPQDTTPTAPELTDEQVAAYLGVDTAYFAEAKGQIKNLDGFYAKVNKRNMELVEKQRALEAQAAAPAPASDDDDVELDAKSAAVLRKFIENEFAPVFQTLAQQNHDAAGQVIEEFSATHKDVNPAEVDDIMTEMGLWDASTTPAKLKKNLERAYKIAKAQAFDPEAEAERIAAERLKGAVKDDEEVIEVKKKRGSVPAPRDEDAVLADSNVSWVDKLKMLGNSE